MFWSLIIRHSWHLGPGTYDINPATEMRSDVMETVIRHDKTAFTSPFSLIHRGMVHECVMGEPSYEHIELKQSSRQLFSVHSTIISNPIGVFFILFCFLLFSLVVSKFSISISSISSELLHVSIKAFISHLFLHVRVRHPKLAYDGNRPFR